MIPEFFSFRLSINSEIPRRRIIFSRSSASLGVLAAISVMLLSAQTPSATRAWSTSRTTDGHPDLQGTLTNSTLTPLERPVEFAQKLTLTDEEAAKYEKQRIAAA